MSSDRDWDYLHRLRLAHKGLCDHVREVHDIPAHGNASQVEAAHRRAHAQEGTPWHDAWQLPQTAQQEARR